MKVFSAWALFLAILLAAGGVWALFTFRTPAGPELLDRDDPQGFVAMSVPDDNPLTKEGVALGRKLFFDPGLSATGTLACSGCHRPDRALADGRPRAVGIHGRVGDRNTPSLFNVGYFYRGLFWDGRVHSLEEQVLHPLSSPTEMGSPWPMVEAYLRGEPAYVKAFRAAFGPGDAISRENLARAMAQYLRTLVSAGSKYDRVQAGEATFSAAEQRGWAIFFDATDSLPHGECAHCHADPLFTNLAFENTGLDAEGEESDLGREQISGRRVDRARFRVPSLRNVALTGPYMHDGRLRTLSEVLDHYMEGGRPGYNVNPNVRPLDLNESHKADVIAFLRTLTDSSALRNLQRVAGAEALTLYPR